jgi:Cu/Ag efflux protein CusF
LTPGRFPRPALATIVLGLALGAAGCGGSGSTGAKEAGPAEPPDQTYTLRGEVAGLPRKSDGLRQIRVHHEPLPDFVGFEGDVVGMASMTMPFPLADSVDLDDVEEGDKVEMTFEVRWEGSPPIRIVELQELPSGTELDFDSEEPLPGENEVEVEGGGSQPP